MVYALMQPRPNGHGNSATPKNETRDARFPLSSSLPQAGERDRVSLREFHVNRRLFSMIATSFLSGILFGTPGGFYPHEQNSLPAAFRDPIAAAKWSAEKPALALPVSFSPAVTQSLPAPNLRTVPSRSRLKKKFPSTSKSAPASAVSEEITNQAAPADEQKSPIHIEHNHESNIVDADLLAGWQAYQNGNFEVASGYYSHVLSQDAANHSSPSRDALLGMAAIAQQHSQYHIAAQLYNQLLALNPLDPDAQAGLTSLLSEKGYASSESHLKLMLARHPEAASLHFALGNHYAELSLWPEAEQAYFNACKLDTGNAQYTFNLAISLDHLGQLKLAEQHYRRALQLDASGNAGFDHTQTQFRLDELKSP